MANIYIYMIMKVKLAIGFDVQVVKAQSEVVNSH